MAKSNKSSVNRRGFLKGAAAGAAALVTKVEIGEAQRGAGAGQGTGAGIGGAPPPSPDRVERDAGNVQPPPLTGRYHTAGIRPHDPGIEGPRRGVCRGQSRFEL
jgi:TAT (twin-arginine translocation) pathway signal sequence